MRRRDFLKKVALAGAGAMVAVPLTRFRELCAMGEASGFRFATLRYEGNWEPRATMASTLLSEVDLRTSVRVASDPVAVSPAQNAVFRYPFLWMSGDRAFEPWPRAAVRNMRRHLRFGGTLFADDVSGREDSGFSESLRRELGRIMPEEKWERLSADHALYRAFYYVGRPAGRKIQNGFMDAISIDDRAAVIHSRNDLSGALARSDSGGWRFDLQTDQPDGRELAIRLGVNLVLYAMTVNYKLDQVHVSYRLRHPLRYPESGPSPQE